MGFGCPSDPEIRENNPPIIKGIIKNMARCHFSVNNFLIELAATVFVKLIIIYAASRKARPVSLINKLSRLAC